MHQFFLSQKTAYFFFTGVISFVAGFFNFGIGYSDADYARNIIFPITLILAAASALHGFYYFRNRFNNSNNLEAGCFGGTTSLLELYNLLFNFVILLLFWQ